jgi:hypothetical protein
MPVPRASGDRALVLIVYLTMNSDRGWQPDGHPCPCRCNAPTSSRLPLAILGLPGASLDNPGPIIVRLRYLRTVSAWATSSGITLDPSAPILRREASPEKRRKYDNFRPVTCRLR